MVVGIPNKRADILGKIRYYELALASYYLAKNLDGIKRVNSKIKEAYKDMKLLYRNIPKRRTLYTIINDRALYLILFKFGDFKAKAKYYELSGIYDVAVRFYESLGLNKDAEKLYLKAAKKCEKEGFYTFAAEYYEKAG